VFTRCDRSSLSKTHEIASISYTYALYVDFHFTASPIKSASRPNIVLRVRISYRMIDEKGFVMDSSSFGISDLLPGDRFRNQNV
jgi:hypothetical protein